MIVADAGSNDAAIWTAAIAALLALGTTLLKGILDGIRDKQIKASLAAADAKAEAARTEAIRIKVALDSENRLTALERAIAELRAK